MLKLDLSNSGDQILMKTLTLLKHQFLDIQKLRIDHIEREDEDFKQFIDNCNPSSLQKFCFNHRYLGDWRIGEKSITIKYYLSQLKGILSKAEKEVYLENLVVDDQDLGDIVKASANSERLTIRYSKVMASPSLDFASPIPYKTQYLSFMDCGYSDWNNMEWDKHPEVFENIVIAIKNSSLKDSLVKINIFGARITIDQVNQLLSTHGLDNITVVTEKNEPLGV
mgnify:CR=1 FL=1